MASKRGPKALEVRVGPTLGPGGRRQSPISPSGPSGPSTSSFLAVNTLGGRWLWRFGGTNVREGRTARTTRTALQKPPKGRTVARTTRLSRLGRPHPDLRLSRLGRPHPDFAPRSGAQRPETIGATGDE